MRRVVEAVRVVVAALVLAAGLAWPCRAAAEPVTLSQVILPLTCTVDIVADGPATNIVLTPTQCIHSPAARQLLAETRQALSVESHGDLVR